MTLNSIVMCTIVLFTIRENSIEFFLEFTVEFFSKGSNHNEYLTKT